MGQSALWISQCSLQLLLEFERDKASRRQNWNMSETLDQIRRSPFLYLFHKILVPIISIQKDLTKTFWRNTNIFIGLGTWIFFGKIFCLFQCHFFSRKINCLEFSRIKNILQLLYRKTRHFCEKKSFFILNIIGILKSAHIRKESS